MSSLKVGEASTTERMERAIARAARDPRARLGAGAVAAAGAAVAAGRIVAHARANGAGPSRAYRLKRKEKPAPGLRRIAYGRIDDALDRLREHDSDPAVAVHEVRKDLKKLRSLLRMAEPSVPKKVYKHETARFRDLGRELASARDAEVKLKTLIGLGQAIGGVEGVDDYAAALAAERDEAAVSNSAIARAIAGLEAAREAIPEWGPEGGWEPAGAGFVRAHRRGRRALAEVEEDPSDEAVHEWRKRSKDLWYQLRILRRAWPKALEPLAEEAHELSDLLGDHHDLAVLAADAADRPTRFANGTQPRLLAAIGARQAELLADALPLGERLYAERPKAFGKRLRAYSRARRL